MVDIDDNLVPLKGETVNYFVDTVSRDHLAAMQASLDTIDDWDEIDRAKVNPIIGQAGIAGGSGVDAANVTRVSLATNVSLPSGTNILGATRFVDESGNAYGVKHIENKPRVSSMPYAWDIAECNFSDHRSLRKFGHNSTVGATSEEVWDGSVAYSYLTSAEQLQVFGGVNDTGNVVSSGTATGGSTTTLVDTGATFQTNGVAAGDMVLNDTETAHAFVLTVDSETQITVSLPFRNGSPVIDAIPFESGDSYRVVNATGTGAAVVQVQGLDSSYIQQEEYIVLNGAADVTTSGSYIRVYRAKVQLAGSTGWNVANIDIENNASAVLLARITAQLNQTLMALWTVPADNVAFLVSFYASTSSSKATEVDLFIRPFGEVFQIKKKITIFEGAERIQYDFPLPIQQKSDIVIKASAAGGGGEVSAGFDLWYESI